MKKNVLRILASVLALTMVLSLAACGGEKGSSGSSSSSSSSSSETSSAADESSSSEASTDESSSEDSSAEAASSSEASTGSTEGLFPTVKAFIEDPTTKAQLDASIEQMVGDDDSMSVALEGSDDTLTYIFKFSDASLGEADLSTMKAALEAGLEEESFVTTFEGIASSVASVVEAETVKVKVIYAKEDGTEIASKEYSGK